MSDTPLTDMLSDSDQLVARHINEQYPRLSSTQRLLRRLSNPASAPAAPAPTTGEQLDQIERTLEQALAREVAAQYLADVVERTLPQIQRATSRDALRDALDRYLRMGR